MGFCVGGFLVLEACEAIRMFPLLIFQGEHEVSMAISRPLSLLPSFFLPLTLHNPFLSLCARGGSGGAQEEEEEEEDLLTVNKE